MAEDLPWEDSLFEGKTENDLKDLLKTLVAFSNSVRPGHIATILIGEKDDGSVSPRAPTCVGVQLREAASSSAWMKWLAYTTTQP